MEAKLFTTNPLTNLTVPEILWLETIVKKYNLPMLSDYDWSCEEYQQHNIDELLTATINYLENRDFPNKFAEDVVICLCDFLFHLEEEFLEDVSI